MAAVMLLLLLQMAASTICRCRCVAFLRHVPVVVIDYQKARVVDTTTAGSYIVVLIVKVAKDYNLCRSLSVAGEHVLLFLELQGLYT